MARLSVSFFAAIWCILIIPIVGLLLSCGSQNHLKLPAGYIDVPPPTQQAVFHGVSHLEGWALSDDGIADVAVYVDRQYVTSAETGLARPDVAKAFPNESGAQAAGWRASLDVSKFPPGRHDIVVQATGKNGARCDVAHFAATVQ
jgi:hypothetical protein